MSELKPCPFCGSRASYVMDENGTAKELGCSNEDCPAFQILWVWHTDWGTNEEAEAIKAWNTRHGE